MRTYSSKTHMTERVTELFNKLNYENWDGYGGHPLSEICYKNILDIIEHADEDVLDYFILFPSPNATFSLELRKLSNIDINMLAAMSIGESGFSYAAMKNYKVNKEKMTGQEDFNAERAAEVLKQMVEFLTA